MQRGHERDCLSHREFFPKRWRGRSPSNDRSRVPVDKEAHKGVSELNKNVLFSTCTNPITHLFYPQKFCIMIVCNFSWGMKMSQGKSKTMPMQIFLGVEAVYYGIVQVVNGVFRTKGAGASKWNWRVLAEIISPGEIACGQLRKFCNCTMGNWTSKFNIGWKQQWAQR